MDWRKEVERLQWEIRTALKIYDNRRWYDGEADRLMASVLKLALTPSLEEPGHKTDTMIPRNYIDNDP